MHKFNPANHKRLDSEERRKIMPPELLIDEIEKSADEYFKKSGSVVFADLGCGSGFFSIPLAKRAKNYKDKNFLLFALDVSEEMLGVFNGNLKKDKEIDPSGEKGSCAIKCVKCEEFFIPLEDNSVDILLLANVFHEIEDKTAYLNEIKRVLKDGGTFFLLDWKKEDVNPVMGPPASERVSAEETIKLLNKSGFKDIKELPLYTASFTFVAKKSKK
ncbi:MAG: class I SAM-dependent methyltransferase [bacterium]|jgi:ubiquinone/menaquinone biosynthesis C-methylase UbiE